jgi:hypothetical protein
MAGNIGARPAESISSPRPGFHHGRAPQAGRT